MKNNMPVFIVDAKRTPIGSFQGNLSSIPGPKLGATVIESIFKSHPFLNEHPEYIDECIMGEVLTAGTGQAPARQAALYAGLSSSTSCMTINKVCGSGLKAIMLASDSIRLNRSHIVIAGGQENMSQAPYILEKAREGYRLGDGAIVDSMIKDGLWDPYNHFHMGNAAEICVKDYKISRKAQDDFSIESYKKAQKAQEKGFFKNEIVPVKIQTSKGKKTILISEDEEPKRALFEKIPSLKPVFQKDGSVTPANSSKINDGASALLLCSEKKVKDFNLKPLAQIISQTHFSNQPEHFTTAPIGAMKKIFSSPEFIENSSNSLNSLKKLNPSDIDLFEINEAFSVVTLVAIEALRLPEDKVNIHGGAIALGHPIGASGARLFTTLLHALILKNKEFGLVTLCIGGGEAVAMIIKRL